MRLGIAWSRGRQPIGAAAPRRGVTWERRSHNSCTEHWSVAAAERQRPRRGGSLYNQHHPKSSGGQMAHQGSRLDGRDGCTISLPPIRHQNDSCIHTCGEKQHNQPGEPEAQRLRRDTCGSGDGADPHSGSHITDTPALIQSVRWRDRQERNRGTWSGLHTVTGYT